MAVRARARRGSAGVRVREVVSACAIVVALVTVAAGLVMFAAAGDPLPPGRKGAAESRYSPLDEEIAAVVADLEPDRRGDG